MISKIIKTIANSGLLVILFGMLIFPILSMGVASYQEKATVLSAQDERENNNEYMRNVPDEVEEVIMKLEREYYQSTESLEQNR